MLSLLIVLFWLFLHSLFFVPYLLFVSPWSLVFLCFFLRCSLLTFLSLPLFVSSPFPFLPPPLLFFSPFFLSPFLSPAPPSFSHPLRSSRCPTPRPLSPFSSLPFSPSPLPFQLCLLFSLLPSFPVSFFPSCLLVLLSRLCSPCFLSRPASFSCFPSFSPHPLLPPALLGSLAFLHPFSSLPLSPVVAFLFLSLLVALLLPLSFSCVYFRSFPFPLLLALCPPSLSPRLSFLALKRQVLPHLNLCVRVFCQIPVSRSICRRYADRIAGPRPRRHRSA